MPIDLRRCIAVALSGTLIHGCRTPRSRPAPAAPGRPAAEEPAAFRDVAAEMGLRYRANAAARRPRDILEANGSGCAFLDYNGDGRLDVLLVGEPYCALYRNDGGRFIDVTAEAGLRIRGHWIGVAAADWDNDGDPDLCLTGYHCGAILRNDGARFREVTAASGVRFPRWGESAAFADVDGDGKLDLYVAAYAEFGPASPRYCPKGGVQAVCGPEIYPPEIGRFFLNHGNGRFEDVTRAAGLSAANGRCWGVMFQDYDDDGRPDLYLANDMTPGDLFHNRTSAVGRPRFEPVGVESGTAFDARGRRQGAMGVDWADYDNDGRPDLLVTTFTAEATCLFHNEGHGVFTEMSDAVGLAQPTTPYVGFGCKFFDYDNDGWRDLLLVNGHMEDNVEQTRYGERYRQPLLLLRNESGMFRDVSAAEMRLPEIAGRGAAYADFDNDGKTDAVVMDLEGAPLLLHNEAAGGHWLGLELVGTRSNRDALGTRVLVETRGRKQRFECQSSGSVLSSNDPRVLIGLGSAAAVDRVTIRWPSGRVSRLESVDADAYRTIQEP